MIEGGAVYRAVSPCGSRCSFSLSWFHDLSKISVLFGSVDASVEGLSRQWMEQTLRPHSPLRVPMNLTSTTFGIRCWDCSATHMMAYSWKHFWMRWIWEESRSLLISLWVCCATKWRFIVLKEISLGTVTLGESFHWLVWLHLPAQTLLGTRVRGEPALDKWRSRTRYAARSFKYTSSGAPLPSKWPYRFGNHCHNRTCVTTGYMLGGPRAQQNIQRGLHTTLLLTVTFLLVPYRGGSSCLLVGLGPIKHVGPMTGCWQSGSTCQVMLTAACTWSCQRILACYRFLHQGTIARRPCAIAPCHRFKIGSSFSLANHTHVCQLVGHCCCHA